MQYPRKIQIGFQEGTCPLRCRKCPGFGEHAKKVKENKKMSLEQSKRLIDEMARMEVVPTVQPHIITEPFANEDLKEIIPYCCSKGMTLSIITNGILLDKAWMDFLIEQLNRNSTISFSLDAVTQETYEKVRGKYSLFELEKKIEYLVDYRGDKGGGPRVGVSFVYEEDNYKEQDAFLEKWKDKVDVVRFNVALDEKGKVPSVFKTQEVVKDAAGCPYVQETMVIDADGEVRVCCRDAFGVTSLGNVFEEGILAVWNGDKRKLLLQRQKEDLLYQRDFCFECEWGYALYNFSETETKDYIINSADYAVYYNRK